MISDAELAAMTVEERLELTRRLAALGHMLPNPAGHRRRRRFIFLLTACSVLLIPWIGLLSVELPHHYVARHWTFTWVGFDCALVIALAVTAWLAWQGRPAVIITAVITGALLFCDAWFDTLTADTGRDTLAALSTALLAEIPLAVIMWRGSARLLRILVVHSYGEAHPTRAFLPPAGTSNTIESVSVPISGTAEGGR